MEESPGIHDVVTQEEQQKIVNRLKRLEGQIRGLQSMVEAGKDCEAILTQVMAARSALNQAALQIIGHSMRTCLADETKERDVVVNDAIALFVKYSGGAV